MMLTQVPHGTTLRAKGETEIMNLLKENIAVTPLPEELYKTAAGLEALCLGEEAWTAEAICETVGHNGCYFAAFSNEKYLGHGGFTFAADEGYITNIAVLPEARRQGVASALIDAMLKKAAGLNLAFLSLEVRESNKAAISLYINKGFTERGVRPNFYRCPLESAVIMTKDI